MLRRIGLWNDRDEAAVDERRRPSVESLDTFSVASTDEEESGKVGFCGGCCLKIRNIFAVLLNAHTEKRQNVTKPNKLTVSKLLI